MSGPARITSPVGRLSGALRKQRGLFGTALLLVLLGAGLSAATPGIAQDTEEPAKALLTVESVKVEPGDPGPDTLCRLAVEVRNQGTEKASQLDFKVEINGQPLAVYRNQLFMFPVAPGETATIQLYNFWSTETSRPMPSDGKMAVEVALVEAQWMSIADEDGVEVWKPLGAVEGLPSSADTTLAMKK